MSNVFSNLAAQSLDSRVGLQPLIPPLFALAPQLLSAATPSAFDDQPAEAAENAIFSNMPSIVADGLIGISVMVKPSKEVIMTEKRMVPPDLVPSDVSPKAISNLSLRHLFNYQHLKNDMRKPVTLFSQSSAPTPTNDESSSENLPSTFFPQEESAENNVAQTSPMPQLSSRADGPPLAQSIQLQAATEPNTENKGMPSSSIHHDDQKHTAENLFQIASTNYEPEHPSAKNHPSIQKSDASHFRYPLPPSDKPFTPLPIQPALPVSLPSLQPEAQSEHIMNRDEVLDQEYSTLAQPQVQSASNPVRRDRFIAPLTDVPTPMYHASKLRRQTTADAQPGTQPEAARQPLSGLDEITIEPLLDQDIVAKEPEQIQASQVAESTGVVQSVKARFIEPTTSTEHISNSSVSHALNLQDGQHSSRDYSMEEDYNAKTEGKLPSIRITIGRVVVRATQPAQPAPIQKRVLRPAQSLDEYLKQRERGSR